MSVLLSVLMLVAGARAMFRPPETSVGLTALVSWLLILNGATDVAHAWPARERGGNRFALILLGLGSACIVAGAYVMLHLSGFGRAMFVGVVCLLGKSLFGFLVSYLHRPVPGASWLKFDGMANSLILGTILTLIWSSWPEFSGRVLGTLGGMSMLFTGFARLMFSVAARQERRALHEQQHEME